MRSHPLRTAALFGAPLLALASIGCTSASDPGVATVRSPSSRATEEIVRLRTHDGEVAVLAGGGGRRVTVYDARGAVLARDADVDDLRAAHPQVVQILETSVASGAFLDATLYEADTTRASGPPLDPAPSAPR